MSLEEALRVRAAAIADRLRGHQPAALRSELDLACAGDSQLRKLVLSLLATDELQTVDSDPPTGPSAGGKLPVIDGYKLVRQIGEGGFGVVYLASQLQPVRRSVAVKILKPGLESKSVLARFEAERQALALMDHPYIAQVFDAGLSADERPYFVMEYADGVPVNTFCDREALGLSERLELMRRVCEGVHHAHQKGVVHRDLKPSNILIRHTESGSIPKIIDFGIARALRQPLTEQPLLTATGQLIGTPEYMSPEQAGSSRSGADTRSDVYSLGVLLYELLTGKLPFESEKLRKAGWGEIQRILCEVDPPKPSTKLTPLRETPHGARSSELTAIASKRGTHARELSRRLRGDLDWIVMRALEKEPGRRYQSADAFAEDLRRHLQSEPVMAGPPSAAYRFRKFTVRHKVAVVSAGLIAAVLMAGATTSTLLAIQASRARDGARESAQLAERERDEAVRQSQISEALTSFLTETIEAPAVDELGPGVRLREILSAGESKLGIADSSEPVVGVSLRLSFGRAYRALGVGRDAERILSEALERAARLDPRDESLELEIRRLLGWVLLESGDQARALAVAGAGMWDLVAGAAHDIGDYDLAELAHHERISSARTEGDRAALARACDALGRLYLDGGHVALAAPLVSEALEIKASLHGVESREYQFTRLTEGYLETSRGRWSDAASVILEARTFYHGLFDIDAPMVALMDLEYAGALEDGGIAPDKRVPDEATLDRLGSLRVVASIQMRNRARTLSRLGREAEAENRFDRAVLIARKLDLTSAAVAEGHTRLARARVLRERGEAARALLEIDAAMGLIKGELHGARAEHLAPYAIERGRCLIALGRTDEAVSELRRAAALRSSGLFAGRWPEAAAGMALAEALVSSGNTDEARVLAQSSIETLRRTWGAQDPRIARLEDEWGDFFAEYSSVPHGQ